MIIRESKDDYMPLHFDKVQRALRLVNRAISFKVFLIWFIKSEPYLECKREHRALFAKELEQAEIEYEARQNGTYVSANGPQ